jgi:hypothetical protein
MESYRRRPMRREKSTRRLRMRRSTFVLATFAAGILTTGAAVQDRPDFSGVWTSTARSAGFTPRGGRAAASLGSGWGESFVITQDADTLLLERTFFTRADLQPAMRFRFALDGSETRNAVLMGRGIQVQVSTAVWEGDKLVITTVFTEPHAVEGQPITSKVTQNLSLQPPSPGRSAWPPSLVVETIRHSVLGGPSSTTRTVYTRN